MSNLERAKKGERLKVVHERLFDRLKPVQGDDRFLTTISNEECERLVDWINSQIDLAVTHAINDTPDPVYWRDLGAEPVKNGDRIFYEDLGRWVVVGEDPDGPPEGYKFYSWIVQRPVKINKELED